MGTGFCPKAIMKLYREIWMFTAAFHSRFTIIGSHENNTWNTQLTQKSMMVGYWLDQESHKRSQQSLNQSCSIMQRIILGTLVTNPHIGRLSFSAGSGRHYGSKPPSERNPISDLRLLTLVHHLQLVSLPFCCGSSNCFPALTDNLSINHHQPSI